MASKKPLTSNNLDALHDSGEEMTTHLDLSSSRRPATETQRINVDVPKWMVESLDHEAERLGVTRQSVIKFWIAEHLESSYPEKNNG